MSLEHGRKCKCKCKYAPLSSSPTLSHNYHHHYKRNACRLALRLAGPRVPLLVQCEPPVGRQAADLRARCQQLEDELLTGCCWVDNLIARPVRRSSSTSFLRVRLCNRRVKSTGAPNKLISAETRLNYGIRAQGGRATGCQLANGDRPPASPDQWPELKRRLEGLGGQKAPSLGAISSGRRGAPGRQPVCGQPGWAGQLWAPSIGRPGEEEKFNLLGATRTCKHPDREHHHALSPGLSGCIQLTELILARS